MTTAATPEPEQPNDSTLSADCRWLAGDIVVAATRDYPPDQRDAVRWLYNFAQSAGWSISRLADETHISASTLSRIFQGKYGAQLDNICDKISAYRRLAEARGTMVKPPFAHTSIARKIFRTCEWALVSQSIAFIFGNRGLGKTTCLEEYQTAHNHGQTKLIRMPASGGVQLTMQEFAKACYISPHSCFDKLRDRVLGAIDHTNLIIIDELHQVFLSYQKGSAVKCLEVIREIHDRTKCGMVLCGTTRLKKELMIGAHVELLEQFTDRGVLKVQLPQKLPRRDLLLIAEGFGLDTEPDGAAAEIVAETLAANSVRRFAKMLQAASRLAHRETAPLSWGHFTKAHDLLAKLGEDSI
jgi:DNA transposition AAA+ family ATPase